MADLSPQILSAEVMQECVRAASIMMYKFRFHEEHYYNATEIAIGLDASVCGSISTFKCDVKHIKLALANEGIRLALRSIFGRAIDFNRSSTTDDIIKDPEYKKKFLKGYRIKFTDSNYYSTNITEKLRVDINILSCNILHKINIGIADRVIVDNNLIDSLITVVDDENINDFIENDVSFELVDDISTSDPSSKKRGRPFISQKEIQKQYKIKNLTAQLLYQKEKNNNITTQLIDQFEETDEEKSIKEISSHLISLINRAGSYTQIINGKECVSIISGLIIQDMISNSGCSMEKIPIIVGQV